MYANFKTEGTCSHDNLIAGPLDGVATKKVVIKMGEVRPRGSLLGRITATKKHVLSVAAAEDGSQTPTAILAEDVDATAGDVEAMAYLSGPFNPASVTFGAGHTAESVEDGLRDINIHFRSVVPA